MTTIGEISKSKNKPFALKLKGAHTGNIVLTNFKEFKKPTFLEYLRGGE